MSFESVYDIASSLQRLHQSRNNEDDSSVGSRESSRSTMSLTRRGSLSNMKKKFRASFRLKPKTLIDKAGEATPGDFEKISEQWCKTCNLKGVPLTNNKKIAKEFEKRIRAVEVKSKLCFAACDLDDDQVLYLCQAIAVYPVITSLDLLGNTRLSYKSVEHLKDLLESELLCASTMAGEEFLYCAGFLSKLALPEHLAASSPLTKPCAELDLINLRLSIGREYRKLNSPDPISDEILHQIWGQVSEAPSKCLKSAVQESIADRTISMLNNYSFHQAEILIVRGMGKANQVTTENVDLVRTSSFFKEPLLPPNDPSPAVLSPKHADLVASAPPESVEEEQLQPLSDTVDDYIDTKEPLKNENVDNTGNLLASPSVDLAQMDPYNNKVITFDQVGSPVSSLGHSMVNSYFDQPMVTTSSQQQPRGGVYSSQQNQPAVGQDSAVSPAVSRQPTLKTQATAATYLTLEQAAPADLREVDDDSQHGQKNRAVEASRLVHDGSFDIIYEDEDILNNRKASESFASSSSKKSDSPVVTATSANHEASMVAIDGSRAYLDDEEDDEVDLDNFPPASSSSYSTKDEQQQRINAALLAAALGEDSQLHTIVEADDEDRDESIGRSRSRSTIDETGKLSKKGSSYSFLDESVHQMNDLDVVDEETDERRSDISSIHAAEENNDQEGGNRLHYMDTSSVSETMDDRYSGHGVADDPYTAATNYDENANMDENNQQDWQGYYDENGNYQYYQYDGIAAVDPAAVTEAAEKAYEEQYEYPAGAAYDNYTNYEGYDTQQPGYDEQQYPPETYGAAADYDGYYYNNNNYDQNPEAYENYTNADQQEQEYDYDQVYANQPNDEEQEVQENMVETAEEDKEEVDGDGNDEYFYPSTDYQQSANVSPTRPGLKRGDVSLHFETCYQQEEATQDEPQFFYNTQPNQEILRKSMSVGGSLSPMNAAAGRKASLDKVFASIDSDLSQSFDPYDLKHRIPAIELETIDPDGVQPEENPLRRHSSTNIRRLSTSTSPRSDPASEHNLNYSANHEESPVNISSSYNSSFAFVDESLLNTKKPAVLPPTTGTVYSIDDISSAVAKRTEQDHQHIDETLVQDYDYYQRLLQRVTESKLRSDECIREGEEEEAKLLELLQQQQQQLLQQQQQQAQEKEESEMATFENSNKVEGGEEEEIILTLPVPKQRSPAKPKAPTTNKITESSPPNQQPANANAKNATPHPRKVAEEAQQKREHFDKLFSEKAAVQNPLSIVVDDGADNQQNSQTSPSAEEKPTTKKPPLGKKSTLIVISKWHEKKLSPLQQIGNARQEIPPPMKHLSPVDMTNIIQLNLTNCQIHDPGALFFTPPVPLASTNQLKKGNSHATTAAVPTIPWQHLVILNLSENQIKSLEVPLPASLKFLDLSKNLISHIQAIRILSLNQQLQYLDLTGNHRMLQKSNASLVGPVIRSWFPRLVLHHIKLLSPYEEDSQDSPAAAAANQKLDNADSNEQQMSRQYYGSPLSPSAVSSSTSSSPNHATKGKPTPHGNNGQNSTVEHKIEKYEEEHILHLIGEAHIRHWRDWKTQMAPITLPPLAHGILNSGSVSSSNGTANNVDKAVVAEEKLTHHSTSSSPTSPHHHHQQQPPLSPARSSSNAETPSSPTEHHANANAHTAANSNSTNKLPVIMHFKGDLQDFHAMKSRILQDLSIRATAKTTPHSNGNSISNAPPTSLLTKPSHHTHITLPSERIKSKNHRIEASIAMKHAPPPPHHTAAAAAAANHHTNVNSSISEEQQQEKDRLRSSLHQKRQEMLKKSIAAHEESVKAQLQQSSIHKKPLSNPAAVTRLITRLHDQRVQDNLRKEKLRKEQEKQAIAERHQSWKQVKQVTESYYERLNNVSRFSTQEMRSQLEAYERSLLLLEEDIASANSSVAASMSMLLQEHKREYDKKQQQQTSEKRRKNKNNKSALSFASLPTMQSNDDAHSEEERKDKKKSSPSQLKTLKSKKQVMSHASSASPKSFRRKKSRTSDGVLGMFTRSSVSMLSHHQDGHGEGDGDEEEEEEVLLVDDLDIDVLVEDDEDGEEDDDDDSLSLSSGSQQQQHHDDDGSRQHQGRSRSNSHDSSASASANSSVVSSVSSISRSSSINHHHSHSHTNHDNNKKTKKNEKRLSVDTSLLSNITHTTTGNASAFPRTGLMKADISKVKKGPMLAPHAYYIAPALSPNQAQSMNGSSSAAAAASDTTNHHATIAIPLSPSLQSLLPRRNLNSDFDIVNALIQSPSSQSAMRSPRSSDGSLRPSSVVHGGNFSPRSSPSSRKHNKNRKHIKNEAGSHGIDDTFRHNPNLDSPGGNSTKSAASSTSLLSSSGASSVSVTSSAALSAAFRLQLPGQFALQQQNGSNSNGNNSNNNNNNYNNNHTKKKNEDDLQSAKNLRRITRTAAAGKAVAEEATGGLDIAEVNAWSQHSRQALSRCAILVHLLVDVAQNTNNSVDNKNNSSSSGTNSSAERYNATYQSICEEWQELGFIFYDTDTTQLSITTSSSHEDDKEDHTFNGEKVPPKPFPGMSSSSSTAPAADSGNLLLTRTSSFHFTASVPRPDFLSVLPRKPSFYYNKNRKNSDAGKEEIEEKEQEEEEEEEEEDPWPQSVIAAKALGLDVTKQECELLWSQLSDYHKLFVQLKSVMDLAVSNNSAHNTSSSNDNSSTDNNTSASTSRSGLNVSAMVQRVLQTPLGQRVAAYATGDSHE